MHIIYFLYFSFSDFAETVFRAPTIDTENITRYTVCPKRLGPFYIVTYYIKWVKTFLTGSKQDTQKNII